MLILNNKNYIIIIPEKKDFSRNIWDKIGGNGNKFPVVSAKRPARCLLPWQRAVPGNTSRRHDAEEEEKKEEKRQTYLYFFIFYIFCLYYYFLCYFFPWRIYSKSLCINCIKNRNHDVMTHKERNVTTSRRRRRRKTSWRAYIFLY